MGILLYGDQPAGFSVLGPEENIRSFSRKDFLAYRKKHYVANATTVVVSGAINEKEVVKKVEKLFRDVPTGAKKGKMKVKESQKKPALHVGYKKTDQTHLTFAFRTFPIKDKRISVARVLSAILGKGMSSRLFAKMRDDLGICYYISAHHSAYTDAGVFSVSAGVDTTRVIIGIENILHELKKMTEELVSPEELKKAKNYIEGTTLLNLETSDAQAEYVAYQEILKREIRTPEKALEEMRKVTAEDVRKLAREIFKDSNLNMAIVGPYEDRKIFEPLLTFKK
jgi:predicted Zn-dependent peptidase